MSIYYHLFAIQCSLRFITHLKFAIFFIYNLYSMVLSTNLPSIPFTLLCKLSKCIFYHVVFAFANAIVFIDICNPTLSPGSFSISIFIHPIHLSCPHIYLSNTFRFIILWIGSRIELFVEMCLPTPYTHICFFII